MQSSDLVGEFGQGLGLAFFVGLCSCIVLMLTTSLARPAGADASSLQALKAQVARIQGSILHRPDRPVLPFGVASIDAAIPGGGIVRGALHEAIGTGADTHLAACPAMFFAGLLARLPGPVVWVVDRQEPFAAGFVSTGFDPDRLIIAEARKDVLLVMEEVLHHAGIVAVVGELSGRLDLTASRRLQLAAEVSGVTAFALRRSRKHDDPVLSEPNASLTRWRITPAPSAPIRSDVPRVTGVGRWRWRLDLARARGGEARSWLVNAPDGQGRLELANNVETKIGQQSEAARRLKGGRQRSEPPTACREPAAASAWLDQAG